MRLDCIMDTVPENSQRPRHATGLGHGDGTRQCRAQDRAVGRPKGPCHPIIQDFPRSICGLANKVIFSFQNQLATLAEKRQTACLSLADILPPVQLLMNCSRSWAQSVWARIAMRLNWYIMDTVTENNLRPGYATVLGMAKKASSADAKIGEVHRWPTVRRSRHFSTPTLDAM